MKERIEVGECNLEIIINFVKDYIEMYMKGIVDYVDLYVYLLLIMVEKVEGRIILVIVVKFENVRLIDNIILMVK